MPGSFYGFNMTLLNVGAGGANDFLPIFTDCEVTVDIEMDQARSAYDIANAGSGNQGGFDYAVQKARNWSVRIGSLLDSTNTPNAVSGRRFGWDLTVLTIGGVDIKDVFTRAALTVTNALASARATRDTVSAANSWRSYAIMSRRLEMDTEAVVIGADLFDTMVGTNSGTYTDANWRATVPLTYSLTGGGLTLSGNGELAGGSFRVPMDAASQGARIVSKGKPTTMTWTPTGVPNAAIMAAVQSSAVTVSLSRPNGTAYTGTAFFTTAGLEAPDGACLQNATLQGSGPLTRS